MNIMRNYSSPPCLALHLAGAAISALAVQSYNLTRRRIYLHAHNRRRRSVVPPRCAVLTFYQIFVHQLADLTTLRSVHAGWLRNFMTCRYCGPTGILLAFLPRTGRPAPESASDGSFFIFMSGFPTGDSHPIYNVPMLGTHNSSHHNPLPAPSLISAFDYTPELESESRSR